MEEIAPWLGQGKKGNCRKGGKSEIGKLGVNWSSGKSLENIDANIAIILWNSSSGCKMIQLALVPLKYVTGPRGAWVEKRNRKSGFRGVKQYQ